jgi:hypothetical protein
MNKSVFRPIQQNEDVSDIVKKVIICLAIFFTFCIALIAGWALLNGHGDDIYQKRIGQKHADHGHEYRLEKEPCFILFF